MPSSSGQPSRRCEQQKIKNIIFKKTGDELEIINTTNRQRYTLHLFKLSPLKIANTDQFPFPTDAAVAISTGRITLPTVVPIHIRNKDGDILGEIEHTGYKELPPDTYYLELSGPIQVYIHAKGSLTLSSNLSQSYIDFNTKTELIIGVCNSCDQPATTITTTDDPKDMMAAVSTFGSALKTLKPERSYPSYRGHPPIIERGDHLQIPATVGPPDTGLQIQLPPTYQSIYTAAPLAYYLGAELVSGDDPRLVTDTGFEYQLDTERGFEAEIEKVLKHVFFIDCLVREEGVYSINLHERRLIEPHLDLDLATLYNQSLAAQVEAYLKVPFQVIKSHIPKWKLTIHMEAAPTSVETLPFVVNDLAIVRIPQQSHASEQAEVKKTAVEDFLRTTAPIRGTRAKEINTKYVQVEQADSLEQMWVGDGIPVNANKAVSTAYQNRLHRLSSDDSTKIIVVCNETPSTNMANDAEMSAERDVIDDVYGSRADLPFDVTILHDLTTEELRTVLATSADFLHYIGHIDDEGINCMNGRLDVRTIDEIGADAFLLNACRSRKQGEALIERGSIGGIVTLNDIINTGAIRMGQTLARLLNGGFPLRAALEIASNDTSFGDQYIVVGDGGLAIAQAESGTPNLCKIIRAIDDQFEVEIEAYPTSQLGMGAAFIPYIESNREYYLNSGIIGKFELSKNELESFLSLENIPVKTEEGLQWSYELDVSSL